MYEFGPFRADAGRRVLLRADEAVAVTPKVFDTLLLLLEKAGTVVTRDELMERLWPDVVVSDTSLTQNIWMLRRALEDESGAEWVRTVPRRGYLFAGEVRRADRDEMRVLPTEPVVPQPATPPPAKGHLLSASVAAGLALAVVVAAALLWPRIHSPRATARPVAASVPSLAAFEFRDLAGGKNGRWLSVAIPEMLASETAAGGTARLVASEDVARARSELALPATDSFGRATLSRIRATLAADLVLAGSFTEIGEGATTGLRVDASLANTRTGEIVAQASVTGTLASLFPMMETLGGRLRASAGFAPLGAQQRNQLASARPRSVEVEKLYAEATARLRLFDAREASELLLRATAADPEFALGYHLLATAWWQLGYDEKARQASDRAMALARKLDRAQQLEIEGFHDTVTRDNAGAAEALAALHRFYPGNIDYAIRLATAQRAAGSAADALTTIRAARRLASAPGDRARVDSEEALVLATLGDLAPALERARAAEATARALGKRALLARALLTASWILDKQGDGAKSAVAAQEAESLSLAIHDASGAAHAINQRANALLTTGNLTESMALYHRALGLCAETGDQRCLGWLLGNLATVQYERSDLAEAEVNYRKALEIALATGDVINQAHTFNNLANVEADRGRLDEAKRLYDESLIRYRKMGDQSGVAVILNNVGQILYDQGDVAGAAAREKESLELSRKLGAKESAGAALQVLAMARAAAGETGAVETFREAVAVRRDMKDEPLVGETLIELSRAETDGGDAVSGERDAREGIAICRRHEMTDQLAAAHDALAWALLARGDLAGARSALAEGRKAAGALRDGTRRRLLTTAALTEAAARNRAAQNLLEPLKSEQAAAAKSGLHLVRLELAEAEGELLAATGSPSARARLSAVASDAAARGLGRIVRRASAANALKTR